MNPDDITPQEPGADPSVDESELRDLLNGNVGDLVDNLPALTNAELDQLAILEQQDKNRTTALGAIAREQGKRDVAVTSPADDESAPPAALGDDSSYAKMRAREIDPSKLTRPVLTLDGWLLPNPAAKPEA